MTWVSAVKPIFFALVTISILVVANALRPRPRSEQRNRLGDLSVVFGVLSLWLFIFPPGVVGGGLLTLAMGFRAIQRPVQFTATNSRMAYAGIVLGFIAIAWGLLWWWIAAEISEGPP